MAVSKGKGAEAAVAVDIKITMRLKHIKRMVLMATDMISSYQ